MKVSIVIPTYNEQKVIKKTLDALIALTYPGVEIIVVDDSTDDTPNLVSQYASQGVTLIHPGGGGRCEARNIGIMKATGDIICVLNADVLLPEDFFERIIPHYKNGADFVVVGSKVTNTRHIYARYVDCCALKKHHEFPNPDWPLWTEGFTCRRDWLIKVGLFPAGFPIAMYAGEDIYLAEKLIAAGAKKITDLSIVVKHIAPDTFHEYWKFRKSRGRASSQYHRYISRWPWWKLTLWNSIKSIFLIFRLITIFPIIFYCYSITRFSTFGKADLFKLVYAHILEKIAFTYGLWQEMFVMFERERVTQWNFETHSYSESN